MERESEPDMPEIAVDKVCFVVIKSRELLAGDEGVGPDASNPSDDGDMAALTDANDAPVRAELREFINGLDVDELDALVALAWIGRGDFDPSEWPSVVSEARARRERNTADYLMGMPLLPDYLEDALSAFDRSCQGFEERSELGG
jgi:hypothetical protein